MTGSTVNIADFRCRAMKSRSEHPRFHIPVRAAELEPIQVARRAAVSSNSQVLDIGIAREAQRLRHHRPVFRPATIERRRAKVIRFGDAPMLLPLSAKTRAALRVGNTPLRMASGADDPFNPPHAA